MPRPQLDRPLKLGTRGSPLAVAQAHEARSRLATAHGVPEAMIEIVTVRASGDRIQDRPLAEIGGKALWTKELDAWLLDGSIDFAVHSAKDVETIRPDGIAMAAILPREDVRDVLVGAQSIAALPPGALVGTSAPRRAAQLLHARPDCRVAPIRGNVATRLARIAAGEADATFLALAGLNRLGEHGTGHPLDPDQWLPAPGQAAIAIECRADDDTTRALIDVIDDATSHAAVRAERALLLALGGNCHSPIAALTRHEGPLLHLRAAIFSPDGAERIEGEARFAAEDGHAAATLAADLLARAPRGHRQSFFRSAAAMNVAGALPAIVIRPQPGCDASVAALRARGIAAHGFALSAIIAQDWDMPDPAGFDAILAGSANAFRHGGDRLVRLRHLPVLAVGEATARAARDAGFAVAVTGNGGLQPVLDSAPGEYRRLLRLAGRQRIALSPPSGVSITEREVYANEPRAMPDALAARLRNPALILLHSAEAARHFSAECATRGLARSHLSLAAIGPRVITKAGDGWARIETAKSANEAALLALAVNMCQGHD